MIVDLIITIGDYTKPN